MTGAPDHCIDPQVGDYPILENPEAVAVVLQHILRCLVLESQRDVSLEHPGWLDNMIVDADQDQITALHLFLRSRLEALHSAYRFPKRCCPCRWPNRPAQLRLNTPLVADGACLRRPPLEVRERAPPERSGLSRPFRQIFELLACCTRIWPNL